MTAPACTLKIPMSGDERHVLSVASEPHGFVAPDERLACHADRLLAAGMIRPDRFDATRFYITDAGRAARKGAAA